MASAGVRGRARSVRAVPLALRAIVAALAALALIAASPPGQAGAARPGAADEARAGLLTGAGGGERVVLARRGGPAPGWGSDQVEPGALVVTTRDAAATRRVGRDGASWLASGGVRTRGVREIAERVTRVDVEPGAEAEAAEALRRQPGVLSVEPDYRFRFLAEPGDPRYAQQWAHAQTGIAAAWQRTTGGADVKVAILDSGIDGRHPDLGPNVVAQVSAAVNDPTDEGTVTEPRDNTANCPPGTPGHSHGTGVAGVAGAVGDNGRGVAGAAWQVGIVDVRVTGAGTCDGPTLSAIVRGLNFVSGWHPDTAAVNLSFGIGLPHCPPSLQVAVDSLRDHGVTVVAASGNDYGYDRMMPAGCDGVVAVGASRGDRALASYSSRQRYVDVVAPGGEIGEGVLTTTPASQQDYDSDHARAYTSMAGTSFAAPYVAGVVALVQDLRRRQGRDPLLPRQVESLLEITARHPTGATRHDPRFGWGILHAGDAIHHVHRSRPIPVPREHPLIRFSRGGGTEPVTQAIAVSQGLFDRREALHVLVARSDDYADALAGSALGFGVGPILFTPPGQPLDPRVRAEIERVLTAGGRAYILGGTQAVDVSVEDELANLLGRSRVRRLSGQVREDTAVAIAHETVRRVGDLGFPVPREVIVATRGNWPDAVAAGSLASLYGIPVLLTPVNSLHPATRQALDVLNPTRVSVVGGTAAVSVTTAAAVNSATGVTARRLSGPARDETAIAVGREIQRRLGQADYLPPLAIAVNLDRPDGYAHTLAASTIAGLTGSVFVPVRWTAQSGTRVTDAVRSYACGVPSPINDPPAAAGGIDVLLAGGTDLLPDAVGQELQRLYDRPYTSC